MKNTPKILFTLIDGEVTGGNMVCFELIVEALRRGWGVVAIAPTDGPLCEEIRRKGVPVYHIETRRTFYWGAPFKIARLIRDHKITLVHAHESFAGAIWARIGGKLAQVPVITHAHVKSPLNRNLFIRMYQLLLNWWTSRKCCSGIIAVSEAVKGDVIDQGTESHKMYVVYNGVNVNSLQGVDSLRIREELGISKDCSIIIHIGRLCKTKGQDILLRAAQIVSSKYPNVTFLFVGEDLASGGAYRRSLDHLAHELRVDHFVWFLGLRRDVPQLLAASDMLVLSSSAEGLPIVILEAMAAGKPVIATPVSGIPEMITHGMTGLLVPVGNVRVLADAILQLIQNPQNAREMGLKGLARVQANFSLSKMLDETFFIYEEVLDFKKQFVAISD